MKKIKVMILVMVGSLLVGCGANNTKKGVTFLEEKKYEEALEAFEKGVEKDKNPGEAYRGMGIAYFETKQYEEAVESFEKALENEVEETGTIYNFLGICNMKLENYENALEAFEKGLAMEDSSKKLRQEMMFNEIAAYEKSGDWENAKIKVKEYTAEYPDDEKAVKEAEFLETR